MIKARRILIADDDPVLQSTVQRVASRWGHQIIQATSGAEVQQRAIESEPEVIVLDMYFPDADGRDVLAQLKADPRTANIPVVVWSGKDRGSDRTISLELGAEDYVEKAEAQLLFTKLERILLRFQAD